MLAILAVISIEKHVKCPGFTCLLRLKNHIEKKKRLLHQATLVLEIKLEDLFVLFEFGP